MTLSEQLLLTFGSLCVSGVGVVAWYVIRKLTETLLETHRTLIEFGVKLNAAMKVIEEVPKLKQDVNLGFERIRQLEMRHDRAKGEKECPT